jgi:hypothetical protein
MLNHRPIRRILLVEILLVEDLGPFAQVLAYFLLLFLGQEGGWSRTPGELLEAVNVLFTEGSAFEVVEVVTIFSL